MSNEMPNNQSKERARTEADSILAAGKAMAGLQSIGEGGIPVAIVPEGYRVEHCEELLPRPIRKRAKIDFTDAQSFCQYVRQHKTGESAVFVDEDYHLPAIRAMLDMHGRNPDQTSWMEHEVKYVVQPSAEWAAWRANSGKPKRQAEFVEWLEDRYPDIVEPSGADVLELCQHLEGRKNAQWESGVRTQNGAHQIRYSEEVTARSNSTNAKGQIEVPQFLAIQVPVFHRDDTKPIDLRLRYRIKDGQLVLWYDIIRLEQVMDEAINELVEDIDQATGIESYRGKIV